MSCEFAHQDGSYVLGALSPAERQEFERHLAGCDACSRSVRELAGLPGLLARVDPAVLTAPLVTEPLPESLLPTLVQHARRTQRRRVLLITAAAAVVAALLVLGAFAVTRGLDGGQAPAAAPSTQTATPPVGLSMSPIGHVPVSANLALTGVLWGTRLELTCSYTGGGEYGTPPPQSYTMFVHTRDGKDEQVASWRGLPGRTMHLAAATAQSRTDITSVVVRNSSGRAVLRLAG